MYLYYQIYFHFDYWGGRHNINEHQIQTNKSYFYRLAKNTDGQRCIVMENPPGEDGAGERADEATNIARAEAAAHSEVATRLKAQNSDLQAQNSTLQAHNSELQSRLVKADEAKKRAEADTAAQLQKAADVEGSLRRKLKLLLQQREAEGAEQAKARADLTSQVSETSGQLSAAEDKAKALALQLDSAQKHVAALTTTAAAKEERVVSLEQGLASEKAGRQKAEEDVRKKIGIITILEDDVQKHEASLSTARRELNGAMERSTTAETALTLKTEEAAATLGDSTQARNKAEASLVEAKAALSKSISVCSGVQELRQRDADKIEKQKNESAVQAKLLGERRVEILALQAQLDQHDTESERLETELRKSFSREMELRKGLRRGVTASGLTPNTFRAYNTPLPKLKTPPPPTASSPKAAKRGQAPEV